MVCEAPAEAHLARSLEVPPKTAFLLASAGGIIVDVRLEEERDLFGVVPGSLHIRLDVLQQVRDRSILMNAHGLSEERGPLLCLCARGNRSQTAARLLRGFGYRDAFSIAGGIYLWEEDGLPICNAPESDPHPSS